jgi:hypothetical protein
MDVGTGRRLCGGIGKTTNPPTLTTAFGWTRGHASLTTTANVYGHLADAMLDRAAARTDVIVGRRASAA